jgi:hypothetical protein
MSKKSKKAGPWSLYWRQYGGIQALIRSPYLWTALAITMVLSPLWAAPGWWDDVIAIVPSLIGLSLAAYAMFLAFGNERFLKIVTNPVKAETGLRPSVYTTTSSAFVHFIVVQSVALGMALASKGWHMPVHPMLSRCLFTIGVSDEVFATATRVFWLLAFWAFTYGVLCGVAATMRVYMLSRWYAALPREELESIKRPPTEAPSDRPHS